MNFFYPLLVMCSELLLANPEDIRDLNPNQLLQLAEDISQINIDDVKDEDIKYFLSTRLHSSPIIINNTNEDLIDLNKPTKFIIHGWIATTRRSWIKQMTDEFLRNGNFNVIQIDWERRARTSYISATVDTKDIGHRIAQFIMNTKVDLNKVHIVGHSLGAHIAGFAAKKINQITGEKIFRVSGVDPAGPLFRVSVSSKDERLDKDDANVVDVIHTDAGVYGLEFPIGTFDIFVNGGRGPQPGCVNNFKGTSLGGLLEHSYCSHEISIAYFIEWINSGKFLCIHCNSRRSIIIENCGKTLFLGENDVDENVTGVCFTKTHQHPPFLLTYN